MVSFFKEDLGVPLFGLRVDLTLDPICFSENSTKNSEYGIQYLGDLGKAVNFIFNDVARYRLVTDKGYLVHESEIKKAYDKTDFPFRSAKLNINKNRQEIILLEMILSNPKHSEEHQTPVELIMDDITTQYLKAKEGKLFLPLVAEKLNLQRATNPRH